MFHESILYFHLFIFFMFCAGNENMTTIPRVRLLWRWSFIQSMMCKNMTFQVALLSGAVRTKYTSKGFFSSMCVHVRLKVSFLSKSPRTVGASIWFLPSVDTYVSCKVCALLCDICAIWAMVQLAVHFRVWPWSRAFTPTTLPVADDQPHLQAMFYLFMRTILS